MRHINRTIFYYLSFFVWHSLTGGMVKYIKVDWRKCFKYFDDLKNKTLTSNIFDNSKCFDSDERSALAYKECFPLEVNANESVKRRGLWETW